MVISPALRQIMADKSSLMSYCSGDLPDFTEIETRLFLLERRINIKLPDHYFQRGKSFAMDGINDLPDLLTKGLVRLGLKHLSYSNHRIKVNSKAFSDWQDLLTLCPPLPLISAVLLEKIFVPNTRSLNDIAEFMRTHILPNTRHSCLPSPLFPVIDHICQTRGFDDLHVHLNGATETDMAWQMFLHKPYEVYRAFGSVSHDKKVKELLEQEAAGFQEPLNIYHLLNKAATIRQLMVDSLFPGNVTLQNFASFKQMGTTQIIKYAGEGALWSTTSRTHPMTSLFNEVGNRIFPWPDTTLEAMMYVLVMDEIRLTSNNDLSAMLHCYLLILGLMNRLIVQQIYQKGFDQFQKITSNGFREPPEKTYAKRFFQMHGNRLENLRLIEARFSPKLSSQKNMAMFVQIMKGWKEFEDHCEKEKARLPDLRLVAHFIKKADNKDYSNLPKMRIRHRKLRIENYKKARALVYTRNRYPGTGRIITGVDAAANELETPPEVFAPVFRYLRRNGIEHFTYHAGEDFHHLIGGLRAIYESIDFLELTRGDRIGHGTAAGINPSIWLRQIGAKFVINQGEWLDDMIFTLHLLERHPESGLSNRIPVIRREIEKYGQEIYGQYYTACTHTKAWRLRRFCPTHMLYDYETAMNMPLWNMDEWQNCGKEKTEPHALDLLSRYHREDCQKRYCKNIELDVIGLLSKGELESLQYIILKELAKREIVLEVLPTSNVRISFYDTHKDHHIFRWLGIRKEDRYNIPMPSVVVGTDDTGIFSTHIHNEYCHIWNQMIHKYECSASEAQQHIRELLLNSEIYAFAN